MTQVRRYREIDRLMLPGEVYDALEIVHREAVARCISTGRQAPTFEQILIGAIRVGLRATIQRPPDPPVSEEVQVATPADAEEPPNAAA